MTTSSNPPIELLDVAQIELETRYKLEFPGFEPATWAAMAYYSKGYPYEDVRLLLAKRFGDKLVADRDALVREAREAGSIAYNPDEPIFEIDDLNGKIGTIPE
jgi:hypothetical protein